MSAWSNAETFAFIELYQREACIWDPKNNDHKDKTKVNNAWIRIADAIGIPVTEVKKKKESLMSAFRLNRKKVLSSCRSADDEDEIFKPAWIYYDAMAAFLSDIYECKPISAAEDQVQIEGTIEDEGPSRSQSSLSDPLANEELSAEVKDENGARITLRASTPVQKRRSHKLLEMQESKTRVKNELSKLNYVVSDNKNGEFEDECDLYGRLLASKLRHYTEIDRHDIMYEIDGLLLKKRKSIIGSRSSSFHKSYY